MHLQWHFLLVNLQNVFSVDMNCKYITNMTYEFCGERRRITDAVNNAESYSELNPVQSVVLMNLFLSLRL